MWQKSIIFNYSFHYFNTITYDSFSLLWNIIFQSLFGCRTCKVHVDKYKIYIANIVNTPHWYRQLVFDVTARDQLMAQIEYHRFIVKMIFFVRALIYFSDQFNCNNFPLLLFVSLIFFNKYSNFNRSFHVSNTNF